MRGQLLLYIVMNSSYFYVLSSMEPIIFTKFAPNVDEGLITMKLIADSGATKSDWACIKKDGTIIRFSSAGYNPNYISQEYITDNIQECFPKELRVNKVDEIFFYGAGVTKLLESFMRSALQKAFPNVTNIYVTSDLIGSAHATLGNQPGFVTILGTGMNSCVYDGKDVVYRIGSLGFILGDEGSGAYLGKVLIRDFMRHNMSDKVYVLVKNKLQKTDDQLIEQIYKRPMPNRFCAQYSKFIEDNLDTDPYFYNLVHDAFDAMFRNMISHYPRYKQYKFNSVGSVGYCFRNILEEVATDYGMELGVILRYPLDGLISYHNK